MRSILPYQSNPALREKAKDIPLADIPGSKIQSLIRRMSELLSKEKHGVALAAPQVGEAVKLFIVSGRAIARDSRNAPDEPDQNEEPSGPVPPDQVYINPEFIKVSRAKTEKHEGCLSVRGMWGMVPRADKASIRAYDENGKMFTRGASGFLAHIFQHEMDHLEGILYTDKATELYEEEPSDEE